uniref:Nucleoid-associated protein MAGMO_1650 n=1 Tax=Magnetococcus massalia (strain MO-1) TaxID=451514 RepID=A0A1S7LI59_MAGMO|nr:conserved protein of unknown function [Candidatus Magnetococcus massalia]
MKGFGNMMKQAQQMQAKMAKMQEELAQLQITGQAGGGMVEITLNGKQSVEGIKIDPKVVDPDDMEMLEDLIIAAFNDAQAKLQGETQKRMADVTGGMNIPGLNLPF